MKSGMPMELRDWIHRPGVARAFRMMQLAQAEGGAGSPGAKPAEAPKAPGKGRFRCLVTAAIAALMPETKCARCLEQRATGVAAGCGSGREDRRAEV